MLQKTAIIVKNNKRHSKNLLKLPIGTMTDMQYNLYKMVTI